MHKALPFWALLGWLILAPAALFGIDANQTALPQPEIESSEPAGVLYTLYQNTPSRIYTNQYIAIKLRSFLETPSFEEITSSIAGYDGVKLLGNDLVWKKEDNQTYTMTLYLKAQGDTIRTPDIDTVLITDQNQSVTHHLQGFAATTLRPLNPPATYSGVIARSISIAGYKIDHYDGQNNILVLDIIGRMANLEDFHLQGMTKQGIDSIRHNLPESRILYYAIIPATQTSITFDYLNSDADNFTTMTLKLDLSRIDENRVSTQTEINPKNSSYLIFKILALFIVIVASLILFYHHRHPLFIAPAVVALILVIILLMPEKAIRIAAGAKVYILPTPTSTIFYMAPAEQEVKKLKEGDGYTKILFDDEKVGWVRNEDIR